jgi:hypothetical protein
MLPPVCPNNGRSARRPIAPADHTLVGETDRRNRLLAGKVQLPRDAKPIVQPAEALAETVVGQRHKYLAALRQNGEYFFELGYGIEVHECRTRRRACEAVLDGVSEHMNSRPQRMNTATLIVPARPGSPRARLTNVGDDGPHIRGRTLMKAHAPARFRFDPQRGSQRIAR